MNAQAARISATVRAYKQRWITAGLCAYCGGKRAPGRRTCPKHAKRTHRCRECDGTGHNVLKCPQLGKVA